MHGAPRYRIGQLVVHRRDATRGVVAGWDPTCRADEAWYLGNPTQPDRNQPWYHVLVHGAEHTTYVAQSNLEAYEGREQVLHPLTRELFDSFSNGRYHPRAGIRFSAQW